METYILSLILSFSSFTGIAQVFCEVNYTNDIEPITYVVFAGIENTTYPEINGSPGHEYFQEDDTLFGFADEGETYSITLEGNTNGDHTNTFTVFIDWNENGDFSDEGEMYLAGFVVNSTGTDSQQAITDLTIPIAVSGTKRMRIIKQRTSSISPEWATDPCGTYKYGQAEDYTLDVTHGDFECEAFYSGDLMNGLGNLQTTRYASDFIIGTIEHEAVYINSLYFKFFGNISSANFYFYEDDNGSPGNLVGNIEDISPVSQTWIDTEFGYNIYEVIFEFPEVYVGSGGDLVWIGINTVAGSEGVANFWETSIGTNNEIAYFSNDDGVTWNPDPEGYDGAFGIWGICGDMNTQENTGFDFIYYPNPVQDILHIKSDKKMKAIYAYDNLGMEKLKTINSQKEDVDLKSFSSGIYFFKVILENGAVETFKVIKK